MGDVLAREPGARAAPRAPLATLVAGRPTRRMTWRELFQISVYWLAINAMWGAWDIQILPVRITTLVCGTLSGAACLGHEQPIIGGLVVGKEFATGLLAFGGALVAVAVQPMAAAVSDYTQTRWGRRKPYIVVFTLLDMVFLAGLAMADTFISVFAFVLLLQASSNAAQGPFQGYVPDLVPEEQVGIASGLMGAMIIAGNVVGLAVAGLALIAGDFRLGLAGVAALELVTMLATVLTVREPPGVAPPRVGGSLRESLGNTARDVAAHHSYVWLLGSRGSFLVGVSLLTRMGQFYMRDSLGLTTEQAGFAVFALGAMVAVMNGLAAFPAGMLSDRLGRKTLIYGACAVCLVGMIPLVFAGRDPSITLGTLSLESGRVDAVFPLAGLAVLVLGVGYGMFVAADWALMTDIIPKQTTGRYMGISNVVTALASPVALLIGGLLATVFNAAVFGLGPRMALAAGVVLFGVAALLLRPVDPRRWEDVHGATDVPPAIPPGTAPGSAA